MRVAILGAGNVGGALGKGWSGAGHAIAYGVPDSTDATHRQAAEAAGNARLGTVAEAAHDADVIVLATPFGAVDAALAVAGDLAGKILIDCTNPLRMGASGLELSLGFDRSGAEHVASLARGASVFKTLNQVGFEVMADATGYAAKPVMFVAGDDQARKPVVMQLVSDLGFRDQRRRRDGRASETARRRGSFRTDGHPPYRSLRDGRRPAGRTLPDNEGFEPGRFDRV